MRILAIRGTDLASLAGPFAVELDAPPLAGSGLFAITGNTGAGKSSILDALCLALFDRIPRLPEGQGVEVGRREEESNQRLKSNDVRSILRRGAGAGHAEVEFRGNDGRAYRARWMVRRARGRAEGRLQQQSMELIDLASGQSLGRTKTEVLEQIQVRLGLTFEQFRRSVLLAQGDFAAFLKARASERAALLERITGSEIYGELSKAAHQRAAEERQILSRLQERLGEHLPLEPEQRSSLEAEYSSAKGNLERLSAEKKQLETARQWYLDMQRLEAEQAQARQALGQAQATRDAAAPRRQEWRRIQDLQPLRQPLQEWDRVVAEENRAQADLAHLKVAEQGLEREVETAAQAANSAASRLGAAETAIAEAAEPLRQARRLDTLIGEADTLLQGVQRQQAELEAKESKALEAHTVLEGQSVQLDQAIREAQAWLAEHTHLSSLAQQWEGWSRELQRYAERRQQLAGETAALTEINARLETLQQEREEQTQSLQAARRQLLELEQTGERLGRQAASVDLQELATQREALQSRERELTALRLLQARVLEQKGRMQELENALAAQRGMCQQEEAAGQRLQQEFAARGAALEEARAALQRLVLANAQSVEKLREGLETGQPCPVCGSLEHPWSGGEGSALERLLNEQQLHVEVQAGELEALRDRLSRTRSNAEHAARKVEELEGEREAVDKVLHQSLLEWRGTASSALRPQEPDEAGLAERILATLEEVAKKSTKVREAEAKGREILRDLEVQRRELEAARKGLSEREPHLRQLEVAVQEAAHQRGQAQRDCERSESELQRLLELLTVPLGGIEHWRQRLEREPAAFYDDCIRECNLWRETAGRLQESQQRRAELEPKRALALQQLERARADLVQGRTAVMEQQTQLEQLRTQRAGVLHGRPADQVEAQLGKACDRAGKEAKAAQAGLAGKRESLMAASGLREAAEQRLVQCEHLLAQVRAELNASLRGHDITEESLRQALIRDHRWLEAEREALDALDAAVEQASGLLQERERRIKQQQSDGAPRQPREQVEALLLDSGRTLEQARDGWALLKGRLEQDDERRKTSSGLQREEEGQLAVCRIWDTMKELIGSADGSKFRSFAQGLTLKLLLAHANVHLRDLARRYLLEPVPGAELELQVIDREMGDEVRSVHSLSGGESFLVSLALALGLASLASERVQVESLFIDEGFGALDAEALDMAIASLDTLYSLGRQVGVISHVPTLVERIGTRVQVESQGGGRSRVRVVGL